VNTGRNNSPPKGRTIYSASTFNLLRMSLLAATVMRLSFPTSSTSLPGGSRFWPSPAWAASGAWRVMYYLPPSHLSAEQHTMTVRGERGEEQCHFPSSFTPAALLAFLIASHSHYTRPTPSPAPSYSLTPPKGAARMGQKKLTSEQIDGGEVG